MKISVCITTFNEEGTVGSLIESLLTQSKKQDEIVFVDSESTDKTVEIIRHFQKKDKRIKLLVEKCTRARGRNLSIENSARDIIAITDAGCLPEKYWLKRITEVFSNREIDIVAGFYKMTANSPKQKGLSYFIGITPKRFNISFLPSTRSMAMRKSAWEVLGGFPESLDNSAEDTDFNFLAIKNGMKIARVKNALVEWGIPVALSEVFKKFSDYARWDIKKGLWWNPIQRFASHNIKVLMLFARYLLGVTLLLLGFSTPLLWTILFYCFLLYIFWAFRKVYKEYGDYRVGIWGIFWQLFSDIAVMHGFIVGIVS